MTFGLDKQFLGYRRITKALQGEGYDINHKRVLRLMRLIGIQAIYPKLNLSKLGNREASICVFIKRH